jgi:hypothetical protein
MVSAGHLAYDASHAVVWHLRAASPKREADCYNTTANGYPFSTRIMEK